MIATKTRKCRVCHAEYEQRQSFAVWCSPACGSVLAFQRLSKAIAYAISEIRRGAK